MAANKKEGTVAESKVFNPFPGLRAFKIRESHLFFGREGQSDEVLLKLSKNRFIGVIGPSGSGKSSFVYCGVLPILYGGFLTDVSADWEVIVTRPGAGPIDNLADALLKTDTAYLEADEEEKKLKKTIISTLLRSSSLGLVEAIEQLKKTTNKNYLILVDQFEELFRFKDSREEGSIDETLAFINLLLEAVNYPDSPIYVALTMRSDFIGECAQFADLTKKINDSHYLIPQMTREQKRTAIEGPVAVGGGEITSRLVQRLLNDLGDNPDQLPILQHSLMRTWDYWERFKDFEDEPLDIKHYESIGTMTEALSLHANEAYDELDERQKLICEVLFKAITERRGEGFGIRRPTKLGDIASIAGAPPKEVAAVVEKFRAPGRSLLVPAAGIVLTPKSVIDISHESLMRIWVRLKNWVEDEAESVNMYMRLSEAANLYQLGKGGLWRPPDLQLALNWEAKHKPTLVWAQRYHPAFERTMEFLAHSKKEYETEQRIKELQQKRRLKTARITAIVMAGLCVVAIGFLLYAFDQSAQAKQQTALALKQQKKADSASTQAFIQKDSAQIQAEIAKEQSELAKEQSALAIKKANEADSASTLAKQEAERAETQAILAEREAKRALEQEGIAKDAQTAAEKSAEEAKIAAALAKKEQYRAKAKAMALNSINYSGGAFINLKGLLAQQAYIFNKSYEGYTYDGDIFNGLYFALKEFNDPLTAYDTVYQVDGDVFLATSSSSNTFYSSSASGEIHNWQIISGTRRNHSKIYKAPEGTIVKAFKISPDNKQLVIAGYKFGIGYAESIDLATKTSKTIVNSGKSILDVEFDNKGGLYLLAENGREIQYFNGSSSNRVVQTKEKLNDILLDHAGKKLFGAGGVLFQRGTLYQYEIGNSFKDSVVDEINNSSISAMAISQDDKTIAYGDQTGLLYLRQIGTDNSTIRTGHKAEITEIEFSFDGDFLGTGSTDKTIRLWNTNDINQPAVELRDHKDDVTSLAFTREGNQIIAGTYDGNVKAWPTRIEQMSDKICQYVTENFTQDQWLQNVGSEYDYEKTCPNIDNATSSIKSED